MTRPTNNMSLFHPHVDAVRTEPTAEDRHRAGLRCAERALQEMAEWDDAREDLRALLDMLGLKTGETR